MKRALSSRKVRLAGAILLTLFAVYTAYVWMRPKTMIDHARAVAYAKLNGNTNLLFDYLHPEESATSGLTRGALHEAYEKLIEPRLKPFRHKVTEKSELLSYGAQGSVQLDLESEDGTRFGILAGPTLADGGRGAFEGVNVFGGLLLTAWMAEYASERKGAPLDPVVRVERIIAAIEKDEPVLTSLGILGVVSAVYEYEEPTDIKLITWAELKEAYRRSLTTLKLQQQQERADAADSSPDSR